MILVWAISVIAYFYGISTGLIQKEFWGQITDFLAHFLAEDELTWEVIGHIHFLRFLVVSPSYFVSELLGARVDLIFTLQIGLYLTLMPFFLYLYRPDSQRKPYKWFFISFFYLSYALLSLTMNGRIVFAHVGFAICLATLCAWDQKRLCKSLFALFYISGIFLCSVSTGTIFIPIILLGVYFLFTLITKIKKEGLSRFDLYVIFSGLFMLLLLSPFFYAQLDKNLSYYDGSFINMMSHGLGKVFMDKLVFLPFILIAMIFLAGFFAYLVQRYNFNKIIVMAIAVAAFGGLFGYSTLSLIFLPILVLIYENIEKTIDYKFIK